MIVVNLEKYSPDGFKKSANSLNSAYPDNVTHVRFYYDDFQGSNFVQGSFVSGKNSTVQADNSAVLFSKFKMFTSTDGVSYTENKTYGGDLGVDVPLNQLTLDPADFADNDIIVKKTIDTVELFQPISLQDLADEVGLTVSGGGGSGDGQKKIILKIFTANGTDLSYEVLHNSTGETISDNGSYDHFISLGVTDSLDKRFLYTSPLYTMYNSINLEFVPPTLTGYIFLTNDGTYPNSPSTCLIAVTDLAFENGISSMVVNHPYVYQINVITTV